MNEQNVDSAKIWTWAYVLSVVLFLGLVARFYQPAYGFTSLIEFGDAFGEKGLPPGKCFIMFHSVGYDGQHYARMALDPLVRNPVVDKAIMDNVPYRARRMLLCWTAWLIGLGRPAWVLQVFALQNVVCWLALAWMLLRWFPPSGFGNYARWAGVLFSAGMLDSVRCSLMDGPALLLIAAALRFCEQRRNLLATGMLTLAGMTRETDLLAFTALADPANRTRRQVVKLAVCGLIAIAPLAIWVAYLKIQLHPRYIGSGNSQNFAIPGTGFIWKWKDIFAEIAHSGWRTPQIGNALAQLALMVQVIFLCARPAISKPAWRIAIPFVALMLCLGQAVWEGCPGAAVRVMLPMALAFNILVPRGRSGLILLLLGNLSVCCMPLLMAPPPIMASVTGPASLLKGANGDRTEVTFGPEWYPAEPEFIGKPLQWCSGPTTVTIHNPQTGPVVGALSLSLAAAGNVAPLPLKLVLNGKQLWSGEVTSEIQKIPLEAIRLLPGDNRLEFNAPKQPAANDGGDSRKLAFCLHGLDLELAGEAGR